MLGHQFNRCSINFIMKLTCSTVAVSVSLIHMQFKAILLLKYCLPTLNVISYCPLMMVDRGYLYINHYYIFFSHFINDFPCSVIVMNVGYNLANSPLSVAHVRIQLFLGKVRRGCPFHKFTFQELQSSDGQ